MIYKIIVAILKPLFYLYFNIEVINKPIRAPQKRLIIAGNHSSWIDPFLFAITFKGQISFLAKEELFNWWIVRKILFAAGMFPVSRGRVDRKAINFAINTLEDEGYLGIFPEGTRSKGDLGEGHNGTAYFAYKTGSDILPVVIQNTTGKFRSKIIIKYCEIIPVEKMKRIEKSSLNNLTENLMNTIERGLKEIGEKSN